MRKTAIIRKKNYRIQLASFFFCSLLDTVCAAESRIFLGKRANTLLKISGLGTENTNYVIIWKQRILIRK